MWPFKKRPREVECTVEAYRRWLRACRPPLPWFLSLAELEQQALAQIGDAYSTDLALAQGEGVRAALGRAATEKPDTIEAEAQALEALGEEVASRLRARAPRKPAAPATMAGFGDRRAAAEAANTPPPAPPRSFLGRKAASP